jgi:hypothetical protein
MIFKQRNFFRRNSDINTPPLNCHENFVRSKELWGIAFAQTTSTVLNRNWLFFAAGPDYEEHGFLSYIKK